MELVKNRLFSLVVGCAVIACWFGIRIVDCIPKNAFTADASAEEEASIESVEMRNAPMKSKLNVRVFVNAASLDDNVLETTATLEVSTSGNGDTVYNPFCDFRLPMGIEFRLLNKKGEEIGVLQDSAVSKQPFISKRTSPKHSDWVRLRHGSTVSQRLHLRFVFDSNDRGALKQCRDGLLSLDATCNSRFISSPLPIGDHPESVHLQRRYRETFADNVIVPNVLTSRIAAIKITEMQ